MQNPIRKFSPQTAPQKIVIILLIIWSIKTEEDKLYVFYISINMKTVSQKKTNQLKEYSK